MRTPLASLVTTAILLIAPSAACSGDDDATPAVTAPDGSTTTSAVTLTTEAGASATELGEQIIVGAGARANVIASSDAATAITELGARFCTTVSLTDWDNGTATLRASLGAYFATYGATEGGEAEDTGLQRAVLASDYAEALALASAQVLCPDLAPSDD